MIKISICGKARSGKDTLKNRIFSLFNSECNMLSTYAFANPIKEIIISIFPEAKRQYLYGPSELRQEVIDKKYKDKNNNPLTYRQALIDIGSLMRSYNSNFFIDKFYDHYNYIKDFDNIPIYIVCDQRFVNEFNALKKENFIKLRIKRKDSLKIQDESETQQDELSDSLFDFIINNDGTISDLDERLKHIFQIY